jgi:hypothetical protein
MDFREYATTETSALIDSLLGPLSQERLRDLQAFRQAVEQATKALEAAVGTAAGRRRETRIRDVAERLTAAAADEARAASDRAYGEAHATIEALHAELQERARELEERSKELNKRARENEALKAAAAEWQAKADALAAKLAIEAQETEAELHRQAEARAALEHDAREARRALDAARIESARLKGDLKTRRAEASRLHDELEAGAAETSRLSADLAARSAEVARLNSELDARTAEVARLGSEIDARDAQLARLAQPATGTSGSADFGAALPEDTEAVQAEVLRLQRELDNRDVEMDGLIAALKDAQLAVRAALNEGSAVSGPDFTATLHLLAASVRRISDRTAATDVLTALAEGLHGDFARVALFRVKGKHLEGVYQAGFDFGTDISKVIVPLAMDSLLSEALASNAVRSFEIHTKAEAARLPFGGIPASGVVLPLAVDGERTAVVYADDAPDHRPGARIDDSKLKIAGLLRHHALTKLEALSFRTKAMAELRAYAALLVEEVEYKFAVDVEAGTTAGDLEKHLRENVACARRIFQDRVATENAAARAILENQLAAVMELKADTPFGRALDKIISRPGTRRTAQAS